MARAVTLQALTRDILRLWPGATVWGKGDPDHLKSASDHNEDDTPGSTPEQTDADSKPEHRAIDVPTLGPITWAVLQELLNRLLRPANRPRLRYLILGQTIWRKRNGWKPEHYNGEYHSHLHVSTDVADDDNAAQWDIDPFVPKPIQRKGGRMFLIHKVVQGVVTFALVGEPGAIVWKASDTITTPEGPIGGQEFANAWARALGDSRGETPLAFAALTMARPVMA